jgi:hypothetical protein
VRRVVCDAEGAPDHFGDPLARPNLPTESVCYCSPLHQRGELRQLLRRQPWLPTRRGMPAQPLNSLFAASFEPLTHCSRRYAQCRGDVLLFPALLLQLPGAPPPSFAPSKPSYTS